MLSSPFQIAPHGSVSSFRVFLIIAGMRYFLLLSWAWAQVLTGVVVDGSTGEPLPGAAVRIQGTSMGTLTNDKGEFQLPLG
jgi:hypothetical protein